MNRDVMAKISTETRQEAYLKRGGSRCPVCNSDQLEGDGPYNADGDYAWHRIKCLRCDSTWNDIYKLSGFDDLEMGLLQAKTDEREIT